jgi:GT2 family glycosyltransferase
MKVVDIIIPTLKRPHAFRCLENLVHVPWPYKLKLVTGGKTWAEAINIGLKDTYGDVILMDDDVFINEDTFSGLDEMYNVADIFGFKLLFPDGNVQHMGGMCRDGGIWHIGYEQRDTFNDPLFVCHVTTSCCYIKRKVLDKIGGMAEDIPGVQFEDVDFNFRALKAGFNIVCLPSSAIHMQTASKKFLPNFDKNMDEAFRTVMKRHLSDPTFRKLAEGYPRPFFKVLA